jgi:hypothetical protein
MKFKLFLVILIFGFAGKVYACKCGGPGTVQESFKGTELIVYGKVIRKDTVRLSETIKEELVSEIREGLKEDKQLLQLFDMTYVLQLELEIKEKYKGLNHRRTIIIYTPLLSASCGFRFQMDDHYIVYASSKNFMRFLFQNRDGSKRHEKGDTFWTTHCTRTTEYLKSEADELRTLKNKRD